jgi:hypothetical protein
MSAWKKAWWTPSRRAALSAALKETYERIRAEKAEGETQPNPADQTGGAS